MHLIAINSIETVGCRTAEPIDEETWGNWKAQECPKEDPWITKGWTQQEIDDWLAKKKEKNKEKKKRAREKKAEEMERSQMALEDPAKQWTVVTLET